MMDKDLAQDQASGPQRAEQTKQDSAANPVAAARGVGAVAETDPPAAALDVAPPPPPAAGQDSGHAPLAPPLPPPQAPTPEPAAAAPPGLLYYAVYLPDPRAPGAASGLPILLPAGAGAAMPAQGFYAAPPAPPAPPPSPAIAPGPGPSSAGLAAQDANQRLLVRAIIGLVFLIHLPWLLYLVAVHGCWGTFIEQCSASAEFDELADTPMMFAQVSYFILRIQSVLVTDLAQFSNMLQLGTGLGSFALTKIVAANGLVATRRASRVSLALTCLIAFLVLFWAELHLTSTTPYPALADETVLAYIDQMLPEDFQSFSNIKATLLQYLQFLRLADALILGAALAMPTAAKKP